MLPGYLVTWVTLNFRYRKVTRLPGYLKFHELDWKVWGFLYIGRYPLLKKRVYSLWTPTHLLEPLLDTDNSIKNRSISEKTKYERINEKELR